MEIAYDEDLIFEIAARFDLRDPNRFALQKVVRSIAKANGKMAEMVADLATGVGKTFLMSALIEYLAQQGARHVLVVTPGTTIQRKTLANFDAASSKYVPGADIAPAVITPENFQMASVGTILRDPNRLKVFVFNVQQLIRPTDKASRKVRDPDENIGNALYSYLKQASDLFVIADEHHVYHEKAKSFSGAIRELSPIALVGLTATPNRADYAKVVFQYTLGEAIADGHVKVPVIVYRKDGTKDERTQLRDACQLLGHKERAYAQYRALTPDAPPVKPVLFVVCQTIEHSAQVGQLLAQPGFIGDPSAVLEITSQSSDDALQALADVEAPESPIRAIVSVNMLREGWDVKNIAVIVALRKLASQTLTEQILGRGLRLPFGKRTDSPSVDQVDLVAHDSYKELLAQKDVLRQRLHLPAAEIDVDEQGAARTATPTPEENKSKDARAESNDGDVGGGSPTGPSASQDGLFDGLGDGYAPWQREEAADDLLAFDDTDDRLNAPQPEPRERVEGAPQIIFPRRESRLVCAPFSLSDIPDGDAQAAGARFIKEVPTFIYRDALEATRWGKEVAISVIPQANQEAQQVLAGLDVVRDELTSAILNQDEVPKDKASKGAARRLVRAFLRGAGVTSEEASAEWGQKRREQAVEGMRSLIRSAISKRRTEVRYELIPVTLPVEPVMMDPSPKDAYNDKFVKHTQFSGWQRNIMPIASFDAGTTEWELATLLDRDDEVLWWLRLYVGGPAFIPTIDGNYFPDFIALDKGGTYWLIEGKADKNANDPDVLRKREAAEQWARSVRDDGDFGTWRYVFAREADIKRAAGSWNGLLVATNPE
ncbi:DEAD/DEAH box helicase family protein [Micromonospora chalcea]